MQPKLKRPLRVGLFGIGLDACWPQFKGLKAAHHCAVGLGLLADKIEKLGKLLQIETAGVC